MRNLFALALLLTALRASAATLAWDAAAPSTNAPAPALYRVLSAPVGTVSNATWTVFGETSVTNTMLLITNNVYRMFQVRAVSAAGVESLPSNVVTNHLAPPLAPTNATINARIESAPSINGPWQELTNVTVTVRIHPETNQFFRTRNELVLH